jgi:SAM-dependent methyltransferase
MVWLHTIYISVIKYFEFRKEFSNFKAQNLKTKSRLSVQWNDRYPCLDDKTSTTHFDRHYVFHTAWAARILADIKPEYHVDISSSLYFCSIVSAFVPVKYYDYRPADLHLDNLESGVADLLNLPFPNGSVRSLSCMHVVEHVGLGRYGDPLDPDGDLKAMAELERVLAEEGSLLVVIPIGLPKIMFNAHRIYSYDQIIGYFSKLELREFTLIPEQSKNGGLIRNASKDQADKETYGCGCFWFVRKS